MHSKRIHAAIYILPLFLASRVLPINSLTQPSNATSKSNEQRDLRSIKHLYIRSAMCQTTLLALDCSTCNAKWNQTQVDLWCPKSCGRGIHGVRRQSITTKCEACLEKERKEELREQEERRKRVEEWRKQVNKE